MTKLQDLFPSANITKMVSRTPGIIYLDIDRTLRPKAGWIQQAVGLDQEGLDRLIEEGKERSCRLPDRLIDMVVKNRFVFYSPGRKKCILLPAMRGSVHRT